MISLKDGRDQLIGSAIYNSKSQIVARRFSRQRQDLDLDFFKRRIAQASEYRDRRKVDPNLRRVVWSESDGLPGVIIDRYGDHFVLQTLTLAMDLRKDLIVEAIVDLFGVENDHRAKRLAGSQSGRTRTARWRLGGSGAVRTDCNHDRNRWATQRSSSKFDVDLLHGQKTGFYLDQAANYSIVATFAQRSSSSGLLCESGRVRARLRAGRRKRCRRGRGKFGERGRRKAKLRSETDLKVRWIEQDVFSFLRGAEKAGAEYDLIILDPPSFTKTKSGLARRAARLSRAAPARVQASLERRFARDFSCSHHVSEAAFAKTIADALVDARRSARRLRRFEQALDHPVLPTIPETEYFKGVLLEMMPGALTRELQTPSSKAKSSFKAPSFKSSRELCFGVLTT